MVPNAETKSDQGTASSAASNGLLSSLGIDFPGGTRQPSVVRFGIAAVVAIALSLLACAILVAIGKSVFPSTVGYEHYSFTDYGKFTILGVGMASLAWPAVTWVSSNARRLFLWLTVVVTIVGLAPDAWILYKGQNPQAVLVLVVMHFALALITYPALVFIAPQRNQRGSA